MNNIKLQIAFSVIFLSFSLKTFGQMTAPSITFDYPTSASIVFDHPTGSSIAFNSTSVGSISLEESKCKYTSDLKVSNFDLKKYLNQSNPTCKSLGCLPPSITICQGKALCNKHQQFGSGLKDIICVGKNDVCPDIETCLGDKLFTNPSQEKSRKTIDSFIKEFGSIDTNNN